MNLEYIEISKDGLKKLRFNFYFHDDFFNSKIKLSSAYIEERLSKRHKFKILKRFNSYSTTLSDLTVEEVKAEYLTPERFDKIQITLLEQIINKIIWEI